MEIIPIIKSDFLKFNEDNTLSEMLGQLRKSNKRAGLIFRNNKYQGVIEKKKLLKIRVDPTKIKLDKFIQRTPLLDEHADVIETAYLMHQSNLDLLPVARNKEIIGVISNLDVARIAAYLPETNGLKVKDIKLIKPGKVQKGGEISSAISVMNQMKIDHIPVFDGQKLYGILSFQDLLKKYMHLSSPQSVSVRFSKMLGGTRSAQVDSSSFSALPIENFSTNQNLVIISGKNSLKEAVDLMDKRSVSGLLVMDGNKLQGMLTVKNILRTIGGLKIPEKFNIRFVGLSELDWNSYEKKALKKIASNESFKLQRFVKNDNFGLVIHLKEYQKGGSRSKISVHMRLEFPGKMVMVSQDDWDWRTAVRKTFVNAENKLRKQFEE